MRKVRENNMFEIIQLFLKDESAYYGLMQMFNPPEQEWMVQEYMKKYDYTDQAKFETEYGKDKLRQSMLFDLAFKVIMDSAVAE